MNNQNRFKLEKSSDSPGWYILTDTENLVVVKFRQHQFNETQRVSILDESRLLADPDCCNKLAHIMSEMGDYMFTRWYSVAMPTPVYEFRHNDEQDKLLLIRNKYPKFSIEIQDDCDAAALSKALAKASEFIKKRSSYAGK